MNEPADILVAGAGPAGLALPDTAFPHLSLIRQTDVERVLAQALAGRGIRVERGTGDAGESMTPS